MEWLNKLISLDRRWIFLFIAIGTALPIIFPIGFKVTTTPPVRSLYERIEALDQDDVVIVSFDFGPSTSPENNPMTDAVLRHCFSKGVRVVVIALFPIHPNGIQMKGTVSFNLGNLNL